MVRHPSPFIPPADTLLDVIQWRADHQSDQVAYVFLRDGVTCDTVLTYGDLDAKARSIAGYLQSRFKSGERLLLVYPPGLDFVQAFWGALYAGLIAVPIPPPDAFRLKHSVARLQGIAMDACSIGVLSTNQIISLAREQCSHGSLIPMEHWISLDDVDSHSSSRWTSTNPIPSALAYLQYTSGSTSAPKGVIVSHGNMAAQSRCITDAGYYNGDSVTLSWMPHFHDYGLVKGIVQPAWIGRPSYIMSPLTFLKRPLRWLEAIQRHHVTHSGGPNFAYRRCVEVVPSEDRARLDLSGWKVASCGAEPIAPDTIDRFVDAFASAGFRREAFFPAYGMAEYTLLISLKREGVPPTVQALDPAALEQGVVSEIEPGASPVRQVIGCGVPAGDTKVVIANPETLSRCAVQQVGEIWLAGASTAQGYWNNPEETARTFGAVLRDTGEGPFLRTGDLGFVKNGEVFVTGRLKDLLIVRGRNHYPQDIERTVEQSHVLCRAGGAAVFSLLESGEETVVVVQEVERQVAACDIDEAAAAMRSAVSEQHDLHIYSIMFIKAGSLPKTSSGKVQRWVCREEFLKNRLAIIGKSVVQPPPQVAATAIIAMAELQGLSPAAQRQRIEQWLQATIADRLGSNHTSVPCDRPVHLLGLDSLMAAEVLHRVEDTFGIPLSLQILLGGTTIGDLAVTIGEEFVLSLNRTHTSISPDTTEWKQENPCLLSESQAALWFLSELVPDSAAPNVSMLLHMPSGIDETILRWALARLGGQHAILRTTYETQQDIPVQRIHDRLPLSWASQDASTWGWGRVRQEVMEVAALPFDLMRGPVWRAAHFHREQDSFLLLVAHHIAVDGWSMDLLVDDLKRHYASAQTQAIDRSEGADRASVPYSDYVAWHRRLLEGEEGRRLSQYWKARLAGELPNYDMLYDRLPTTIEPGLYAWHSFHIDATLVERLKAFAQMEGTTLYAVCLAALQVLLYRYTDIEETTVASPTSGRSRSRFAQTVGNFVNILVLRDTVRAECTGRDLLAQAKRTVLEALDHQDYPYARLVSDLRPARDLQRAPLAKILFVLQKFKLLTELDARMGASAQTSAGEKPREWDAYVIPQQSGQFDLCIELAESDQGLSGYFEYKEQLFAPDRVARMQEHFVRVLEGLVSNPAVPIGELPLMSNAEHQETVFAWSRSQEPAKSGQCLHRLIEAQAQRTPDAIAVRQDGQTVTYHDLNERANRVAHYLCQRGVVPGVVVGLCLERSINLIVGMLGILKSGGAYLPLDIDYPADRLEYMLRDSQVQVLVIQQDQLGRMPATNLQTICLDSEWETIALSSDKVVEGTEAPDNLAYVIYTSGSTGHPKGVMIEHRSIANYVHAITDIVGLTARDRVLQFASLSFDTAAEEIFPCLATGGMLVLRTSTMVDSVSGFLNRCRDWHVTVLDLPTSYWHEVVVCMESERVAFPASVTTVIIGGERVLPQIVQRWAKSVGSSVRLLNTYGPTETTVAVTVSDLTGVGVAGDLQGDLPIGRVIPQASVYVLDRNRQPVPVGVAGELYVGGVGVARGYMGRPDLTEEKFMLDPFSQQAGARLYRTGDLVRWRVDGQLDYRGRVDRQVKIRGYRIELEEIEAILNRHPDLERAVVEVREDQPGDKRIVAFLVPHPHNRLGIVQFREQLSRLLPAHMIPSLFIELETLPLTANGKVDRRALRVAADSRASKVELTSEYLAPRDATEQMLAHIWSEILHIKDVGVHDNFFELGGHSLLATQLVSRVQALFRITLPLLQVFTRPTIAGLADAIRAAQDGRNPAQEVTRQSIARVARGMPLPLSFAQERMWFLYQLSPDAAAYNIPASVRLHGPLNKAALRWSVDELVRRHEALRTTFTKLDGQPRQMIHHSLEPLWIDEDLRMLLEGVRESRALELATAEARRPFDLERGPLLRILLIQMGDEDHVLVVSTHHIISDQWSYGVIVRELVKCYNSFCAGNPVSSQPDLDIQYADFAQWQRAWLTGPVLAKQLAHWTPKLTDLPMVTLPADRPRLPVHSFKGDHVSLDLSWTLVNRLKQLSVHQGVTLYMVFLAGFFGLLHRITQQRDLVIGTPIANRNRLEIEDLIGTFVNTLVLRTDVTGDMTFLELLTKVRDLSLDAYAHQDIPFEKLVEELRPDRSQGGLPLVQVLFNFANTPFARTEFQHVSWTPYEVSRGAAQLDIGLSIDPLASRKAYLEFNTDLFDRTSAERWLAQYRQFMEMIAQHPNEQIGRVAILTEQEQHQILRKWNATGRPFDLEVCFPQLFEAQVIRTPGAIAVRFEGMELSYADLNQRANRLAHHLREQGVGPDVVVPVLLERSLELVISLLAIMKAGGAYLPLVPGLPLRRVSEMIGTGQACVLVTNSVLLATLPLHQLETVCLERDADLLARYSVDNLSPTAGPHNLVYVLFTSGSTGRPKEVEISHRALTNFLLAMQQEPGCSARDVMVSVTPLSFDIAGLELYVPLLVGACIEFAGQSVAIDGRQLRKLCESAQPTLMQATPATWRMLIEAGWLGSDRLTVLCGGEALQPDLAAALLDRSAALWNMYGPTETTIWSTIERIERADQEITIGRPIANTEMYILDQFLQPVPVGVSGELYIGGQGLARGYRGQPELTKERFIPHPFSAEPLARLYRTGDVARYRPDGRIVHLGRLDRQVKIRGFRIELGEIEAALSRHPAVRQEVVMAWDDQQGLKQLAAYVVCQEGPALSPTELRSFLRAAIPDYMVPSLFVFLKTMPLTANNKVDMRALPAPASVPSDGLAHIGPRDWAEVQLTALWQQVLEVPKIGIHDNFFDLGGHSLKAAQLFFLLEQVYGRHLPLATLFQAPTIAELASVLSREQWVPPWQSLVAIQPSGTAIPIFMVPGVGGNVLVFAQLAKLLGMDQPFYGLQARGLDGKETPFTSVPEMARHYIGEIRTVRPHGPYIILGICTGGLIAYEMAQQLLDQGETASLVMLDTWHPSSYRPHRYQWSIRFWLFLFIVWRTIGNIHVLLRMPVKDWLPFVQRKSERLLSFLRSRAGEDDLFVEFQVERVSQSTRQAVARYVMRKYPGHILNIVASKRNVAETVTDTRHVWEELGGEGSQTVRVGARDSGLLLTSPHVGEVSGHLQAFLAGERQDQNAGNRPSS